MGLFKRKRFVWNEPWFFLQRIRTVQNWVRVALFLLVPAVIVGLVLYFSARPGNPANPLEVIGISLGFAAAIWWVVDGTNTRRQAILFEDTLTVGGDMGKYSHPTTYKMSQIPGAAIVLPDESKWPEPALYFLYNGEEQVIGIEKQVSLKRLAQALHDAGVLVVLKGWRPNEENEFEKAFSWEADPKDVTERAELTVLPPGTPSMMNVGGILLAIFHQCWAIALWLAITAGAVYYGYQNWNNLDIVRVGLLFIVPIGAMYLAGTYTDRIATAATSKGLIRMAKDQLRKRNGIQLNVDGPDLIPVEIFARDQFDKSIQKMREMGFVQPDASGQRILFEGKKERWTIPANSIRSIAIEEVQIGTPGQSAMGALNYYVVVKFVADQEQEFGFRYSERDYGEMNDVKRAEGGIRLFEVFDSLLKSQLVAAS